MLPFNSVCELCSVIDARFGGRRFFQAIGSTGRCMAAVLAAVALSLSGPATAEVQGGDADAVVDPVAGLTDSVQPGPPVYATLGAALSMAPPDGRSPYRVYVAPGTYREKLFIDRPDVHLIGSDREATVISWSDSAATAGPDGTPLGTAGSATLTVAAPGFRAERLTIENDFDYPGNRALPDDDPRKVQQMQAVAMYTTGDSDRAVFVDVTLSGYQDTLFVDAGRHWFQNCRILGHVDFIFGAGQAVFEDCDIISRNRMDKNPTGYVTAPSTHVSEPYGLLFLNSRFLRETPDVPAASVRLGRPWHPNSDPTAEGSAVFVNCYMDDHIGEQGYAPISGAGPDGERIWFEVDERSRFFEFGNHGPGALQSADRRWLTAGQVAWYTREQVLRDWQPWRED